MTKGMVKILLQCMCVCVCTGVGGRCHASLYSYSNCMLKKLPLIQLLNPMKPLTLHQHFTWSLYIIPQNKMTALMLAAVYGQLEVVEILIGAGAKLDIADRVSCNVELS